MGIGKKWFGKREAAVSGIDKWAAHDPTKTWTDGGAVAKVVSDTNKTLISQLERIVAENANAGVSEYLSTAEVGLRADGTGEVLVGLRISNDIADIIVEIPIRKLVIGALTEMRPTLGVDQQAQAALSALISLGNSLSSLAKSPAPPPIPAGPAASPGRLSPTPVRIQDTLYTGAILGGSS